MINIVGSTKLLGVIGCPVSHSLSPAMHNAALADRATRAGQTFLDYVYVPLEITGANLSTALLGMTVMGWQGFNVTIPHKQAILPYLKEISPLAKAVGAVNTVSHTSEGWVGTNTDVQGFLAPLQEFNYPWQTLKACVLGNGGATRAVVAACAQLGFAEIHVAGRDWSKLQSLQSSLRLANISIEIQNWQSLSALLPQIMLVVNATPIGMHPQVETSPLSSAAIAQLPSTAIVYDLIYTPRPTYLLTLAQQHGYKTIDGLEMLVQQGAAAFKIWTGDVPSLPIMRQAVLEHLAA